MIAFLRGLAKSYMPTRWLDLLVLVVICGNFVLYSYVLFSLEESDPLHSKEFGKQFDETQPMQPKWAAVVEGIVEQVVNVVPSTRAVYVRGSVAAGTAHDGTSDIDLLLVYSGKKPQELRPYTKNVAFVRDISVDLEDVTRIGRSLETRFSWGMFSRCVYGAMLRSKTTAASAENLCWFLCFRR